jgi:diguanylate cyclase (GGDEF)-like protein
MGNLVPLVVGLFVIRRSSGIVAGRHSPYNRIPETPSSLPRFRLEQITLSHFNRFPVDRRVGNSAPEPRPDLSAWPPVLGPAPSLPPDELLAAIAARIDSCLAPRYWSLLLHHEETRAHFSPIACRPHSSLDTFAAPGGVGRYPQAHFVAVPLRFDGCVLGVIEFLPAHSVEFSDRDLLLLQTLADYAAIAIENARQIRRAHELSITDDCTSLFNVRHMHAVLDAEIQRSRRHSLEFTLIFFDLDFFKRVNDAYGHLVGTRLLAEIAHAVRADCRLMDFAFRYGGDEFIVLLPQTSRENGLIVARRLHALIRESRWLKSEGLHLHITASFGVAEFPAVSSEKAELLRAADEAMYAVKNASRDGIAIACGKTLAATP